jgi:hypothetical protein
MAHAAATGERRALLQNTRMTNDSLRCTSLLYNADIQAAFSLVTGPFCARIGACLFAAEAVSKMDVKGEFAGAGKVTPKTAA